MIGSYVLELTSHPGAVDALWGGVPRSIRPYYSAGMILAAIGYFAFTYFLLFRMDSGQGDGIRTRRRENFSSFVHGDSHTLRALDAGDLLGDRKAKRLAGVGRAHHPDIGCYFFPGIIRGAVGHTTPGAGVGAHPGCDRKYFLLYTNGYP